MIDTLKSNTKMFNYAKTVIKAICHDYYQESCILLMFLTLLVGIACLWVSLSQKGTETPGAGAAHTLRVEQRRRQA